MKKKFSSLLLLGLSLTSFPVVAQEPVNLNVYREKLVRYHDSGEYESDINRVIHQAELYLKKKLTKHHSAQGRKPAIVLDIDETALSNYEGMLSVKFGGNSKSFNESENKANAPAVTPTLRLYKLAQTNGVSVIFLTGRHESKQKREVTAKNLKKAGYNHWDKLILKPETFHHKPAGLYKSAVRKKLTEEGYDIIVNIGDQKSDLVGNYAHKAFKLPNPYYYIP